ncbi:helix-turn-helix domain-containing protein [Latilactobacillus sp. 5-91]|uniref:helix-turn-helix domain-containing protein n=1 Tax=Latilactobacillus sp. 5-91 TaxID=3410924 RepID=UPI003C70D599
MFPNRLKTLRNEHSWTQADLAQRINVSPKTIGTWERGTREPPIETITKLSDIFEVSSDYLLGKTENKSISKTKEAEITDEHTIMTFEGKPIQPEDLDLIKRLLRGKE